MYHVRGVGNIMFVMREWEHCDNDRNRESVYVLGDGMKSLRITNNIMVCAPALYFIGNKTRRKSCASSGFAGPVLGPWIEPSLIYY